MALQYYLIVFGRAAAFAGFVMLHCFHRILQAAVWYSNGTGDKVREAKKCNGYDRCIQVVDIRLFYSFDPMIFYSRRNFIYTHNRFENPRYLIDNGHVTLITLDTEYAIFGEARSKGMQLWKTEYSGFMTQAQLNYCNKLILVPMEHFHRITEELQTINMEQIIFLFNTGRCGSTLMSQILEKSGHCVSISEPGPLFVLLAKQLNQQVSNEHLIDLCKDLVRWICRPCTDFQPLIYFIKVAPSASMILPIVFGAFPRSKYLFMYRNANDVARSFYKVVHELPFMFLLSTLAKLSPSIRTKFLATFNMQSDFERSGAVWDDMVLGVIGFIKVCQLYLESRRNALPISAIRYEDLITHPRCSISAIFNYCDLPKSLVERSMEGLASDAQRNSALSVDKLRRHKIQQLSSTSKRFVDELLRKYDLPLLDEDCILEGTITLLQ